VLLMYTVAEDFLIFKQCFFNFFISVFKSARSMGILNRSFIILNIESSFSHVILWNMNNTEKIKKLQEVIKDLETKLDEATSVKKSEVYLNQSFKHTIEKQGIVIDELRKVIDKLVDALAALRLKLKDLIIN
jgi:hypothetical protein